MVSTTALPVPPPNYGGIEKVVYDLSAELSVLGHEVAVAATTDSVLPEGVRLVPTVPSGRLNNEQRAYDVYKGMVGEYDIICDHSLFKVASRQVFRAEGPCYIPVCHTLDLPAFSTRTPRLVCVSKSHAAYIGQKYGCSPRYVYNGVRPAEYSASTSSLNERKRFLFIGRLSPEKGALEAIMICKSLSVPLDVVEGRGRESGRLVVARGLASLGLPVDYLAKWFYRGPYGIDYLLRAVRETRSAGCRYLSGIDHKQKVELLYSARALLFPVQYEEPFGLAVVEAMICGTPVVAYSRGAMPELIEDGVTGFLVKPGDKAGFIEALSKIDNVDPGGCRNHVLSKFTSSIMAKNYEALFMDALLGAVW